MRKCRAGIKQERTGIPRADANGVLNVWQPGIPISAHTQADTGKKTDKGNIRIDLQGAPRGLQALVVVPRTHHQYEGAHGQHQGVFPVQYQSLPGQVDRPALVVLTGFPPSPGISLMVPPGQVCQGQRIIRLKLNRPVQEVQGRPVIVRSQCEQVRQRSQVQVIGADIPRAFAL